MGQSFKHVLAVVIVIALIIGLALILYKAREIKMEESLKYYNQKFIGIVYILPSKACTPYWRKVYHDRIYFYVYGNLEKYKDYIKEDFMIIKKYYNFVVIVIPADDIPQYFKNLRILDEIARESGLKIIFAIFPKSKYGPEHTYLIPGTRMYDLVIRDMEFMARLRSVMGIAIWYGWKGHVHTFEEVRRFYESLPEKLKKYYMIWLDGIFVEYAVKAGIAAYINSVNGTAITELYSPHAIAKYACAFKNQFIVSGFNGAKDVKEWVVKMREILAYTKCEKEGYKPRILIVWIFYDENDGHGELCRAYINGELRNPFVKE